MKAVRTLSVSLDEERSCQHNGSPTCHEPATVAVVWQVGSRHEGVLFENVERAHYYCGPHAHQAIQDEHRKER